MKRIGARRVWSVPEVTGAIARRFEDLPSVWVEAEVQNLRRGGGQVYFTLRDRHQIDASMNAIVWERLSPPPGDGGQVYAYGRVEYWAERSQVRMRVERLEPAGDGALRAQITALRATLEREGLLSAERKRPLPMLPRRIGIITSATGAARDDVLRNLWERHPDADVVFHAVPVQGDAAAPAIVRALRTLAAIPDVDVVIVTRGGGALEDLMAFNSEDVCRAVAASRAPVVSAVGHERDTTLCDLVADLRVSTPTAAARAVVPEVRDVRARLDTAGARLVRALHHAQADAETALARRHTALLAGLRGVGDRAAARAESAAARMAPALHRHAQRAADAAEGSGARMGQAMRVHVRQAGAHLETRAGMLDILAPARTVARGYAIIRDPDTGTPLVDAAALHAGAGIHIQMRDGTAAATIRSNGA